MTRRRLLATLVSAPAAVLLPDVRRASWWTRSRAVIGEAVWRINGVLHRRPMHEGETRVTTPPVRADDVLDYVAVSRDADGPPIELFVPFDAGATLPEVGRMVDHGAILHGAIPGTLDWWGPA